MRVLRLTMIVVAVLLAAGACRHWGTHSKASVERAINEHLAQNRHLKSDSFQTKVESVDFKGDTADAVVRFQSRQTASLFVEVRYGLRLDKGQWQVISSTPLSGQGGQAADSHNSPQDQNFGTPAAPEPAPPATPAPQPPH